MTEKHSYEIIVLDLDGTLTNRDKVITPKTKQRLMELQERGKKIVLASGRPTPGVLPLARELDLAKYGSYILSFNGGRITNCKTGEIIFSRSLPQEANQKIIRLAEEEQVGLLSYDEAGAKLLTNQSDSPYAKLEARINGMELVQVDDMEAAITYPVPKYLMMEDGDYLAMVEPRVKAAMGKNFSVYRSEPFFLEVLPRGIDKAQSLERLLSHIGLSREQMIACGDGYNDRGRRSDGECGASGAESCRLYYLFQQRRRCGSCGGEVYAVEDLTDSHKCILREQMKNKIFIKIGKILDFKTLIC